MLFLLAIVLGAAGTMALAPSTIRLAIRLNAIDFTRSELGAYGSVPRLGGVLLFAATVIACVIMLPWWPTAIGQSASILSQKLNAFILGAALILILGILDDIHGLRARWKLIGQILVASLVWWMGLRIEVITNLFNFSAPLSLGTLSLPLTVIWLLLCINAINIIDGIDCLAGGIAALGTMFFLVQSLVSGQIFLGVAASVVLGALMAFLVLNYRKKLYLGDSGSMLLGFMLASFVPLSSPKSSGFASVVIPLGVMSVPIAEVFVTTLRRLIQGKPLGAADLEHLHHRLMRLGLSTRRVAIIINTVCFLCGILALGMTKAFVPEIAFALGVVWVALLVIFFALGYRSPDKGNGHNLIRNTLFLDGERILQKRLAPLNKGSGLESLDEILATYKDHLDLGHLSLIFRSEDQSEVFSKTLGNPPSGGEEAVNVELVLRSPTSRGAGEIRANLNPRDQYDLDRVRYWLNKLLHEVANSLEQSAEQNIEQNNARV